ncbi:hypothetical protein DICVIV_02611 [Dictyocaulus viviparus]|uniref:ER membrane protein complex subunit 1 n=1 Tax=Dictyocaulus viviparus TaxID=29172 RepID=A0A0D8Y9K6_DICVI|nr:hypothetical protein DICVIV_02611 [Dictyocaulus viviparus]
MATAHSLAIKINSVFFVLIYLFAENVTTPHNFSASGLESTSLMLAYGIDLFFTRLHPSGTFDILKDDFDHVLISVVLSGLIAGCIVSKKLARSNALSAAWA